jgi:hypothetical protein
MQAAEIWSSLRFTAIVGQVTTPRRVRLQATSGEMDITHVGNVMLVAHKRTRKLTTDFMGCFMCVENPQTFLHDDLTSNILLKPGEARTSEKTLQHVEAQVQMACLGVAERVKELQTSTGIKDAFTQHWIDELLDRARDLKKQYPQRTTTDIQMELMNWVDENKDNVYNSFLTLEGI